MKTCEHINLKKTSVTKKFLGHTFSGEGRKCSDCGAVLWDNKLSQDFNVWLKNLDIDNQKQYVLSDVANNFLQEFVKQNSCKDESSLVRSIIAVMNSKMSEPSYNEMFAEIMASKEFKQLEGLPATISKKVRITNPKSLYDLENWKEITGMNDSEFIRTSIMIVLIMSTQVNTKFAEFWREQFKTYLDVAFAA